MLFYFSYLISLMIGVLLTLSQKEKGLNLAVTRYYLDANFITNQLGQLVEHRTSVREVMGSNPGRTNT